MEDITTIINTIKNQKTIALLAPSFPVDFEFPQIITQLRQIWFDKVVELTYAAKLINQKYHKLIKENPDNQHICTNCPTVTKYISAKYPQHKNKLVNIWSPMVIMSRIVKQEFWNDYKTVFIGPCLAKKIEAKETGDTDEALTFVELQQIFDHYTSNKIEYCKYDTTNITETGDPDFDKFYNDYTKIYPLTWSVANSMHYKDILNEDQVLIADEISNIDKAIQQMEENKNIKFFDGLACLWGCIWWPWIISKASTKKKEDLIYKYKNYCKKDKIWSKLWKAQQADHIEFQNKLLK